MLPNTHPDVQFGKTGLLLVNLGTPDSPDKKGLRPYLKQFLSDRRVIEAPPAIWQPILRGIILNTRPKKSAEAYAKIWRQESNESPLRYYTRVQAEKLRTQLGDGVMVDWAMRYGKPSIEDRLKVMKDAGCERIAIIALYPQYSASTSASVYDDVFRALLKLRWQPAIRTAAPWHDHPAYIDALAQSVTTHIDGLDFDPEVIIASFHGLPQSYFEKGDPYHCHCAKTARLLREKLGMDADKLRLTFQSRFGPTKWLEPYTDKTVIELAEQGVKKVAVVTPGFISDCVETLEEIGIALHEDFAAAGGTHFSTVPCLNDSALSQNLLQIIAERELSGWTH
ncbi:MAG: ferrochelatase [Alphaproteobacteria bacterium]|nr:ferrochelatase [Alphaproteobacteria bacterium]